MDTKFASTEKKVTCWWTASFSFLEGAWALATGILLTMPEQQLVDYDIF